MSVFFRQSMKRALLVRLVMVAGLSMAPRAHAAELDAFQTLLGHTGLPASLGLLTGETLSPDKARALWQGLVTSPATARSFAPRMVLASLLRQVLASHSSLAYSELCARTERYAPLVVIRPDGYAIAALTGHPLASLGQPTLREGELYVQGLRVGAFYFDEGRVFFAVDDALHKQGPPLGEWSLARDPATAALLGSEQAFEEMARGLATLFTHPARTLADLSHLPRVVASLLSSSPEYFARYSAMNLEDQVRELARLTTHLLTLQAGAATLGPRLAEASRLSVLTLSAQGTFAMSEVALPAGTMTVMVGAGAASVSLVMRAQGPQMPDASRAWTPPVGGPGQWLQKPESMSPEAQHYQTQITGAPEGWVYRVRFGPGPKDIVDFDGFKGGVLLEVKGPGYQELLQKMQGKIWFRGAQGMLEQAQRQFKAAGKLPIQWHFAEQDVADFMQGEFEGAGLDQLQVIHTPVAP